MVTTDPLLPYVQEHLEQSLTGAAANMTATLKVLAAGHAMATAANDPAADGLHESITQMTAVRESLLQYAASFGHEALEDQRSESLVRQDHSHGCSGPAPGRRPL